MFRSTLAQGVLKCVGIGGAWPPICNPFKFYQSGRGKSSPENWANFGFEANLEGICYRILVDFGSGFGGFLSRIWGGVSQTPPKEHSLASAFALAKESVVEAPGHQFVTRSNSTRAVVAKALPKTRTIWRRFLERFLGEI